MAKTETFPWDPAEHLENEEDMAMYLNIALEDGDPLLIVATLQDIARARRILGMPREDALNAENLCESLSNTRNPEFSTVLTVVGALGFRLRVDLASQDSNK